MTRFARESDITDNQTGKVDAAYEAEVAAHTANRERAYAKAQRSLEAAQLRHAAEVKRAEEEKSKRGQQAQFRRVQRAWTLVEERLRELRVLERLMTSVPASRDHRGRGQAMHRS